MTRAWWRSIWRSPMAEEYLDTDVQALFRLAVLVDAFWVQPSDKLAAEIRLQQQCFGLTPIDRRRLQWEVERAQAARQKRERPEREARPVPAEDPRKFLRAVK
jgi:hypothetical protein